MKFKRIIGLDNGSDVYRRPKLDDLNEEYNSYHLNNPNHNKIFEYIKEDALTFLNNTNEKFDLIIFNQFLHFFDNSEMINYLLVARNLLNDKGIIYIKVANNKHSYSTQPNRFTFTSNTIRTLNIMFEMPYINDLGNWDEIIITKMHPELVF